MGHDIDSEAKAIDRHSAHQGAFIIPINEKDNREHAAQGETSPEARKGPYKPL